MIWSAFAASMVVVTGVLSLIGGPQSATAGGRVLTPLAQLEGGAATMESAVRTEVPIEADRWTAIVVHHSASFADSPATIDDRHRRAGLASLGYHFVIGDGARMGDGDVHVGERWLAQQPGAHVAGVRGAEYNASSIGVCLVGDGDRRRPTDAQIRGLVRLVTDLAQRLDIPRERIVLHSDLARTTSPGRLFPASMFYEQIAWLD
ncbi:MAG: peptidoglycan recognition family protein [Planctomycetota bacterium]